MQDSNYVSLKYIEVVVTNPSSKDNWLMVHSESADCFYLNHI